MSDRPEGVWRKRLADDLSALRAEDALRTLVPVASPPPSDDKRPIRLSSNDYLGLSTRSDLWKAFLSQEAATGDVVSPMSASASRLLDGNRPDNERLEDALRDLYPGKDALVVGSGYHANVGTLSCLVRRGDLILGDKLNHASLIDGMRLSEAEFRRYPHLDYDRLRRRLETERGSYESVFIVSESVFSMDGDTADLSRLVELKRRYDAVLVVDEAHAVGVFGKEGAGVAARDGLLDEIDVLVGTFGKAYCSIGAFVLSDAIIRETLVNRMRTFIFTTALPPINLRWSRFVLEHARGMDAQRKTLLDLAARLRTGIREKGFETGGDSQIVPLYVGENAETVRLARRLREAGIGVFPIRPPTVPQGTARLRFSLHAGLSEEDIEEVLSHL